MGLPARCQFGTQGVKGHQNVRQITLLLVVLTSYLPIQAVGVEMRDTEPEEDFREEDLDEDVDENG